MDKPRDHITIGFSISKEIGDKVWNKKECFDVYYLIENLKYKFSKKHDVYGSKEYEQGFTDGANQVIDYIESLCTKELKI